MASEIEKEIELHNFIIDCRIEAGERKMNMARDIESRFISTVFESMCEHHKLERDKVEWTANILNMTIEIHSVKDYSLETTKTVLALKEICNSVGWTIKDYTKSTIFL